MTYGTIHTGVFHKDTPLLRLTSLGWTFYVAVATSAISVFTFGLVCILYACETRTTGTDSTEESKFFFISVVSMTYGTIHTGVFHKDISLLRLTSLGWTFYVAVARSALLVFTIALVLYNVFKCRKTGKLSPKNPSKLRKHFSD